MKILIMAFYDDNFGDMLIRTNFTQLLRVVLSDLDIQDAEIDSMHLREVEEASVREADLIVFSGGAIFGINYLDLFEHMKRVLTLADEEKIPVVFSSMGYNNADATEDDLQKLRSFLQMDCIKAISVREDPERFRYYAGDSRVPIDAVCDPAVWSAYTYAADLGQRRRRESGDKALIGINVVRGGLFRANGIEWNIRQEELFLEAYARALEEAGYDYRFFTNGSVTDCSALLQFADLYEIPGDKVVVPDTTRAMVQAVADFDAVAAIRMHASITAYAMGIPSVNLVWNPKIRHFYRNIGFPERAIELEDWTPERLVSETEVMLSAGPEGPCPDPEFLMSLYRYLHRTMKELFRPDHSAEPMEFEAVCDQLAKMEIPASEDMVDITLKLAKAQNHYLNLSKTDRERRKEIRTLNRRIEKQKEKRQILREKLKASKAQSEERWQKLKQQRETIDRLKEDKEKLEKELQRIYDKKIVRVYRTLKGTDKKG